jgi:peptidyl-prolyl cis-trans isomerase D
MSISPAGAEPIPDLLPGEDLMKLIFSLEKPGDIPDSILPLRTGHAILQLKEKTPATREQFEKEKDYYLDSIRAAKQNDALVAYVKRLQSVLAKDVVYKNVVDEPEIKQGDESQPQPDMDDLPGE